MAIKKIITIDKIEVPFKASAAVPRLYRLKFSRDIYKDFAALQKNVTVWSSLKPAKIRTKRPTTTGIRACISP